MASKFVLFGIAAVMFFAGFIYYPKWKKGGSEATISWDASGYYHYLPGLFIYHDLKSQQWMDSINSKYLPSPAYDQAYTHPKSGNKVNKYFIGQAVLFTPGFLVAHTYAKIFHTYPADGYSRPYQMGVWLSGLLFSFLGLWVLRKILLAYFNDGIAACVLILVSLGTNYLDYASITNGMNHTWLFTLLCLLIFFTIRFYKTLDWKSASALGLTMGLIVVTRPTELIWILVPLLWNWTSVPDRWRFLMINAGKILTALAIALVVASIQPIYWKYVSGEWLVYTYRDQGFNFLHPRIYKGLFGTNIGWWSYTPLMFVAMFGWFSFYKQYKSIFWSIFITSLLAIYITLSWKHFESGGGLGQRNLIQIYPLLCFPLASLIQQLYQRRKWIPVWITLGLFFIYYNSWWIHQAHHGGFFKPGEMTTGFFMRVVGRIHPNKDYMKLLDTKEYFEGNPRQSQLISKEDFNSDTSVLTVAYSNDNRCIRLNTENQWYVMTISPGSMECNTWLRCSADFEIASREWDVWKYTQWIVQFYNGENEIKKNLIKIQRLLPEDHKSTHLYFDVKLPGSPFTKCTMTLWNAGSSNTIFMDNLEINCISD